MPLAPVSADDRKRAGDCAAVRLQADRIIRQETRTNRDRLLWGFWLWLAEHFGTTLHELLFAGGLDPEFISEILVTYGFFFCNLLKFTVFFDVTQIWLGDLRVVLVVCFVCCLVWFDLPAFMDLLCPCTNVVLTVYAHVRTEPQCDIGHTRGKKKNNLLKFTAGL